MGDRRNSRDQPAAADGDGEEVNGVEAPARRHSPWTQVEHLLFLLGLEDHGRGAWRAIAMDYCVSRTPTQVASHAQKYFLRQELTPSRRHKKRPSIHDITRASISPYATSSERDRMRVTLQEIVRAGRDMAGASDSNDNSASSSGKSVSSTCLPVSDPIFGQVFAFTIDSAAAATNSGVGVDVTFGVAGAQQMQQVQQVQQMQQMQYAVMHPMHGSGAASTAPGAVGSWTLPGGAVLAPMHMPPAMQLQPAPYPGPMQMVQPQARLAYMTPGPGAPWPQQAPQHGPVQTLQPVYPSRPKMPLAQRSMLPGATRPACTTGPVARFAARRAAAQRGSAAPPHSAPVNPAPSADAAYSHGMSGAGWVTVPTQGPHGNPSLPQAPPAGAGRLTAHQSLGETALWPDAHGQVMLSAPASTQVSQVVPHPAPQQQQQPWPLMARQQSTDSAPASSEKAGTPRDHRGTKRDGETVQNLMHGQQPRQYLAQWQPGAQPGAQPQASFQASGTPSAGPHHRPGLQMPLWPAGGGSAGPPLAAPQYRAAVTMGDGNTVNAVQVSSSRALMSTLSEPLNVVGSGSGTGFGSSYHVAWRSTVPESQHGPGVGSEVSSPNHVPLPLTQAPFAQRPSGDKMKWPSTHGMHGMPLPMPMQSPAGDLAPQQQPEPSPQLPAYSAQLPAYSAQLPAYSAQPPHYPAPAAASLLRSVSACEAQLPQVPFSASTQLPSPPLSAPAPHGSGAGVSRGAQTPPRGPPGGRSPGIADSCSGRSMHASSFQPFAHEAGSWSAHAGDALGAGSLQETGDGIVDYLLGNMPLLADPLLDADVFEKSSSGSTGAGSGSAGARAGVAGGGAQ